MEKEKNKQEIKEKQEYLVLGYFSFDDRPNSEVIYQNGLIECEQVIKSTNTLSWANNKEIDSLNSEDKKKYTYLQEKGICLNDNVSNIVSIPNLTRLVKLNFMRWL